MVRQNLFGLVLADDEPAIRRGIAENVPWADLGFQILALCKDGQEALQVMRTRPVDVVLADIRMPGCSGVELARTIRRESPTTYVLFLSAYSDFSYAQCAIEYGVWRYLVKPVQFRELLTTFQELYQELERARQENEYLRDRPTEHDRLIRTVHDYVRSHYREASLRTVAEHVNLSPEYLSRLYYAKTGTHFSDYLHDVRMGEAARLLRSSSYRVYEISDIVGYANPKNFSRRFHAYFGLSPKQYRNRS